jgi:hypothetical protein
VVGCEKAGWRDEKRRRVVGFGMSSSIADESMIRECAKALRTFKFSKDLPFLQVTAPFSLATQPSLP